jgi:hypothetical protein
MVSSYAYAMVLLGESAEHSYLNRQSQVYRSALEHSRDRIMIFGFSDISTSPVCRVDDAGNIPLYVVHWRRSCLTHFR